MSFDLYPLFPTVIAKKSIAVEFTTDEINSLYSTDIFLQNLGNGLSFNEFLLNDPKFKRLKQLCLDHAQEYFTDIMKYDYDLHMTNSWLNVTQSGQEHMLHNHTNSMVSGVLYLKTSDSTPSISFNNLSPAFLLNLKPEEHTMFNSMEWELPVEDNCIVLFPSQCFHYVKKNTSNNERVSIAFNTFVNGNISSTTPGGDLNLGNN
jgi:uncharacterized protein (TIGR02466 family)|tara:strand:+ start:49 stop:663 length:615 start_codon:yes stop_codon:yes gene_type:complete